MLLFGLRGCDCVSTGPRLATELFVSADASKSRRPAPLNVRIIRYADTLFARCYIRVRGSGLGMRLQRPTSLDPGEIGVDDWLSDQFASALARGLFKPRKTSGRKRCRLPNESVLAGFQVRVYLSRKKKRFSRPVHDIRQRVRADRKSPA
jgi:hypothetical protein